jgi:transcriptional regulator GlxA family with amidase domain
MKHSFESHGRAAAGRAPRNSVYLAVRRAERLILIELDEPRSAQSLARAVGVSARSLYRGFQQLRGYGPGEAVRRARLRRVRLDLLTAGPKERVTDAAMRWGFYHLGRFSSLYSERFGELPSETRRRSRLATTIARCA